MNRRLFRSIGVMIDFVDLWNKKGKRDVSIFLLDYICELIYMQVHVVIIELER
jgi:hypothetical protein